MWVRCLQGGIALLSSCLAPKCMDQVWTSGQQLVYLQNSSFDDLFSRYLDEQQVRSLCSEVNRIWSSADDESLVFYREQVILINWGKSLQPLELLVNHNGRTLPRYLTMSNSRIPHLSPSAVFSPRPVKIA
jgi:hypothetical protein